MMNKKRRRKNSLVTIIAILAIIQYGRKKKYDKVCTSYPCDQRTTEWKNTGNARLQKI